MGLDIGIISITYLERPWGHAYDFAKEMAWNPNVYRYMHGEGNNWCAFTQRQVLQMLDEFIAQKGLDSSAKAEILGWLRSLPWDAWRDDLDLTPDTDDDEDSYPFADPDRDGGIIELHFNW